MYKGQKITLQPMPPAEIVQADKERLAIPDVTAPITNRPAIKLKNHSLLAHKSDLYADAAPTVYYALICKDALFAIHDLACTLPPAVADILQAYEDVFPSEFSPRLPPLTGIEHQIDLIPGASLPNRAAYRTNPRRLKRFSDKSKSFWTASMCVKALVLVLYLCFWFLRKMVHGTCV
jgi:hypothetical protein